jgi:hypothetical protein
MSDYYREQLRYGSVVPGGSGPPTDQDPEPGSDRQLKVRGPDAQLAVLSVTIVKSADVYGTGIDYDSLYFGLGRVSSWRRAQNALVLRQETLYFRRGPRAIVRAYPRPYTGAGIQGCVTRRVYRAHDPAQVAFGRRATAVQDRSARTTIRPARWPTTPSRSTARANSFGQTPRTSTARCGPASA